MSKGYYGGGGINNYGVVGTSSNSSSISGAGGGGGGGIGSAGFGYSGPGRKPGVPNRNKKDDKYASKSLPKAKSIAHVVEKIPNIVPESQIFMQLLDIERKVDYNILRKQVELGETFRARAHRDARLMRLHISNTYDNQAASYHLEDKSEMNLQEPPSWTIRVEGGSIDDDSKFSRRKLSSFFSKIVIALDERIEDNLIEWKKAIGQPDVDGLEIKRSCTFESMATIMFYIDYTTPRYKVSPILSSVLSIHTETRTTIIVLMWQYIKLHRLVDPEDKRQVLFNEPLKKVFSSDKALFTSLPEMLREHMSPADPITINYKVRVAGDPHAYEHNYNVYIDEDNDPMLPQLQLSQGRKKDVTALDETISSNIKEIHEHLKRREFMYGLAVDPISFINKLIYNQIRDMKFSVNEDARETEEERYSMFFNQPYTVEAVDRFVQSININIPTAGM